MHDSYDPDVIHEINVNKRRIKLKKGPQKDYGNLINDKVLTIATGPPGTGKTFIAVAMALKLFTENVIQKIIMVRPAVTAGEDLGYLPGDMHHKIDPFLRPITDALHYFIGVEDTNRLVHGGQIELACVAYMRGRTFADAFVICDEAQNMTIPQMKMLVTRIGPNCTMVIDGDLTQIDLQDQNGGLLDLIQRAEGDKDVGVVRMTATENYRHPLVQRLAESYDPEVPEKPITYFDAVRLESEDSL